MTWLLACDKGSLAGLCMHYDYGSGVMRQNVYSSAVFTGLTSLHSNFTWTGSSPSIILGIEKLETLGYPMMKTASLWVPSF